MREASDAVEMFEYHKWTIELTDILFKYGVKKRS